MERCDWITEIFEQKYFVTTITGANNEKERLALNRPVQPSLRHSVTKCGNYGFTFCIEDITRRGGTVSMILYTNLNTMHAYLVAIAQCQNDGFTGWYKTWTLDWTEKEFCMHVRLVSSKLQLD